jgi:AAHS family 4-hydroxybenzoate transporter-like MFS transporter
VPLGGISAAYLAPILMSGGGWRSLFIVGGLLPLLFCAALAVWLPESVQHEARAGKNPEKTRALLRQMFPALVVPEGQGFTVLSGEKSTGVAALFKDGNTVLTITIWALFFLNLLCLYTLTFWLPTFFTERHWPPAAALRTSAMFQLGGIVGGQLAGLLSERIGKRPVLLGTFFFAGIFVMGLGRVGGSMAVMTMLLAAAGFMVIGSQQCLTGYTAAAYHTGIRATGIGWGLGIGRFGAVLGPSFIGFGLSAGFSQPNLFAITAIPAFISCLLMPALWYGEIASAGRAGGAPSAERQNVQL